MLKKLAALCLALTVIAVYTAAQAQRTSRSPQWVKLASRNIDLRTGRATLGVSSRRGVMKAIRFRASRRNLRLTGATVYFRGGGQQRLGGISLRANRNSRSYAIRGGKSIARITVTYSRVNSARRWIGLQVYGAPAAADKSQPRIVIGNKKPRADKGPRAPAKFNDRRLNPKRPGAFVLRNRRVRQRDGTYRIVTERVRSNQPAAQRQAGRTPARTLVKKSGPRSNTVTAQNRQLQREATRRERTRQPVAGQPRALRQGQSRDTFAKSGNSGERAGVNKSGRALNGVNQPRTSRRVTRSLQAPPPVAIAPPAPPARRAVQPPPPPTIASRRQSTGQGESTGQDESNTRSAAAERRVEEDIIDEEVAPKPDEPGPAKTSKDFDIMPVYYGTNRVMKQGEKRIEYLSDDGEKLQLGRALVTVPKTHTMPNVERPWAIHIPWWGKLQLQSEDPKKHFTIRELKQLREEDFLRFVKQRLARSKVYKDQALVFIHGFNNTFDGAIYRTAQIAFDLKFDSAPFLYSWPSAGGLANYFADRESAEAARVHLRQFLELITKKTGVKSVSIIAHSMGNVALLQVLRDLKYSTPDSVKINQIILAAPDVGVKNFKNLARDFLGLATGVTLYASSNDRALGLSKQFYGAPRAGDVPEGGPVVVEGVDTIDVSAVSTDSLAINHSTYAQTTDLMNDIESLLKTGARPPQARNNSLEVVVKTGPGGKAAFLPNGNPARYWRYP